MPDEFSELEKVLRGADRKVSDEKDTKGTIGVPVESELIIESTKISFDIANLELIQPIDGHHILKVQIHSRGELEQGKDLDDNVSEYTQYLGKSVSLSLKPFSGQIDASRKLTFVGVITHVEVNNGIGSLDSVTLIAHSPTILMDVAKANAFFTDQSASDIMGSIVRNYSITLGDTDSTSGQMRFCVQYRETDYDFVCRLATGAGMFAFYDGSKFYITKKGVKESEELAWRQTLGMFSFRWGTALADYSSGVYNYSEKKTFLQDTASISAKAALSNISKISADASKELFDKTGFHEGVNSLSDAKSLDSLLTVLQGQSLGRMVSCKGTSIVPSVAVGHRVKITNMANFDGEYLVLSVTHHVDEKGHYSNSFTCSPLDLAHAQTHSKRPKTSYLQSAEVVDNADPDKLGRVKVKFPWNENEDTIWVRVAVPHAGDGHGWYSVPEIGDEVLVGYEQGSPDLPIILGSLYNGQGTPSSDVVKDSNAVKGFITKSGNKILIDDSDGEEKIGIVAKDGTQVILNAKDPSITIKTSGDISLEAANISLTADNKIAITGGQIEIKSNGDIKSEASMNMDTKAGIQYKIQGTMVEVKGTPIQLN